MSSTNRNLLKLSVISLVVGLVVG